MSTRRSSASRVRKRPAGPVPARATPSQFSLPPAAAHRDLDISLRGSQSANSEMNLTSSAPASGAVVQRAETDLGNASTMLFEKIMDQLRVLGHWPTAPTGYECTLRTQICRHIEDGVFSKAQTAEIQAMKKSMEAVAESNIMQDIQDLVCMPKGSGEQEQGAVETSTISPSEKQEAEALTVDHQVSPVPKGSAEQEQSAVKTSTMTPSEKQEAEALTVVHQVSPLPKGRAMQEHSAVKTSRISPSEKQEAEASPAEPLDVPPEIPQPLNPPNASTATSLKKRPAATRAKRDVCNLAEAIDTLGRFPKRKLHPKTPEQIAENNLAMRLHKLQRKGIDGGSHLARVLNNLPPDIRPNVKDEVINEVRVLGHLPKRKRNPAGEQQKAENKLARRLSRLCRKGGATQTHDAVELGSNTDAAQTDDATQVGT